MTSPRLFLAILLVLAAPTASADPNDVVDPNQPLTCLQIEGPDGPLLAREGCSGDASTISVTSVLHEDRATADVVFEHRVGLTVGHADPVVVNFNSHPAAQPPPEEAIVWFRVRVHAEWDAGCADPRGSYRIELQDGARSEELPTLALAQLCGAVSPAAARAMLEDLARDLLHGAPEQGAAAQALVDGLPAPDVQPLQDAIEEIRHVEIDGGGEGEADPDGRAGAGGDASVGAGDVSVGTGTVGAGVAASTLLDASAPVATPDAAPPAPPTLASVAPAHAAPPPPAPEPRAEPRPAPAPAAPIPAPAPIARVAATVVADATVRAPPEATAAVAAGAAGALLLLALALYLRLGRHSALLHPARAALHRAAAAAGPAPVGALAAAVGIERKRAEYHLRYLVRAGVLREHARPDGAALYATPEVRVQGAQEPLAARLVDALRARPGQSAVELARGAGVGYGRVDRRLKDLLRDGALESRVEAGERRYFASA